METKVEPYPESEEEIEPYSDNEEEIEPFPNDVDDQLEGISETHNEACKGINCANHDGIELRQKACPQNCISRLSSYDLLELRKNKPSSQKEHTQWLLDFFFEHSTQDTVCHLVCGKEICEKCWRALERGEKTHNNLNKNHIRLQIMVYPAGMKKTEVWKMMASDLDSQSLTKSSFLKIWNKSFPHITVVKENPFSKCHLCTTLHFEFEKCGRYERDAKMIILDRKKQHWDYVRRQKEAYYERREVSRLYPSKCLTIIMDGMDQKKTNIPILFSKSRNSKQIANLQQIRTHLLGLLVHRDSEVSGARKVGYGYFDLLQYPHDSNLNLTVLLQTLLDYKDCLGRELHLQTDSASDNKNKTVLGFLGIMVHLGIFEECYLHMLPVGHTHEDIDAMFSNFSTLLKADIMTLEELIKTLQKLSYIKESKVVKNVWDFKDWMVHHSVNNHGLGDQYEFRIHALDKDSRAPIFHYRRGEGERWLPDCEDENTFEHQQDKCGIRIFKDMDFLKRNPKCVVPTDKSMYLSRIIQETCPKLLESGLLKPAEKQWWEEFSSTVRESYLTPSINVNFPLESLIHVRRESSESSNSIASVERTLQELVDKTKRKSLVYTGRYLTQKKRKTAG